MPQFFWVHQGDTHADEVAGGCLWAPERYANGSALVHWESISQVQPGDIIFVYANGHLRGHATGGAAVRGRPSEDLAVVGRPFIARRRVRQVQDGDMRPVEAMLFVQAMKLETIFTNLVRRAANQEYLKQFQTHLTLALKAQAQCRATLEALAEIKNPRPVLIAKQANVANGPQQVNNGSAAASVTVRAGAHAEQTAASQNGLLEARSDEVAVSRHRHELTRQDGSHVQHSG